MPKFIVTVEFQNVDSIAVEVEAASKVQAEDIAFMAYLEDADGDRPELAEALTVAEFEDSFGAYTPGMFPTIPV